MTENYQIVLEAIWKRYSKLNPQAEKIQKLLTLRGEKVVNDHIAFRTVASKNIGLDAHIRFFEQFGYEAKSDYYFSKKKLLASHLENKAPNLPKIFVSQLVTGKFSPFVQSEMRKLERFYCHIPFKHSFNSGRLWNVSYETYNKLADESEYAAWLYLYGMCANHFTVLVNDLNSFESVEEVNVWVKSIGFEVNKFGGEVKGSPETMLEQSSTMAHKLVIDFKEGQFKVPSCYYEFAKRYKDTDQKYFSGFVTQSANNIFDSTSQKAA